jgi:hypothetical protein
MLHLPFMEDIRQYTFPSLSPTQPSVEQLAAVDNLISTMDLMTADRDEEGKPCEAVKPKLTMNLLTQRVFQCITHRALSPEALLPEVESGVRRVLEPGPALLALCSSALAGLQEQYPLVRVEKKERSRAAAVWKESSGLDLDAEAPPTKKSRIEEDTDFSMASLARGEVTEVSLSSQESVSCGPVTVPLGRNTGSCGRLLQNYLQKGF